MAGAGFSTGAPAANARARIRFDAARPGRAGPAAATAADTQGGMPC